MVTVVVTLFLACVEITETAMQSLFSRHNQGSQPIEEVIMIYFIDGEAP
jgi:hypothetical protein